MSTTQSRLVLGVLGILLIGYHLYSHFRDLLSSGEFAVPIVVEAMIDGSGPLVVPELFVRTGDRDLKIRTLKSQDDTYRASIVQRNVSGIAFQFEGNDPSGRFRALSVTVGDRVVSFSPEQLSGGWVHQDGLHRLVVPDIAAHGKWINVPSNTDLMKSFLVREWPQAALLVGLFAFLFWALPWVQSRPKRFEAAGFLQNPWIWFGLLFFAAALLRLLSFDKVVYMDQPVYLVISDRMRHGEWLYIDALDTKAPGLFLYYYLLSFLGRSLEVVRITECLLLAGSAFLLGRVASWFFELVGKPDRTIPWIASFGYIVVSCFDGFNYWTNPEEIVSFLVILAVYLLLLRRSWSVVAVSGVLGLAFLTKYSAVSYYAFVAVVWLVFEHKSGRSILSYVGAIAASLLFFVLPSAVFSLVYAVSGHLDALLHYLNVVFVVYPDGHKASEMLKTLMVLPLKFTWMALAFALGIVATLRMWSSLATLVVALWTLASVLSVLAPGHAFIHYWFEFWPVLCLVLPLSVEALAALLPKGWGMTKNWLLMGGTALLCLWILSNNVYRWTKPDPVVEIARDLKQELHPSDTIYAVGNESPALYWLLDKKPLTKNIHQMFQLSDPAELVQFEKAKPNYVIVARDYFRSGQWAELLRANYSLQREVGGFEVYRLDGEKS